MTKNNVLYIFGNGISRKPIDPSKLNGYIYGCNRFYQEYPSSDKIFVADQPMAKEILFSNFSGIVVYRHSLLSRAEVAEQIKEKPSWLPFKPEARGLAGKRQKGNYSSGARALIWAIHIDPLQRQKEWDEIYLLGFDFHNMKGQKPYKALNIYKGKEFYQQDTSVGTGSDFQKQIDPYRKKFIRVVDDNTVLVKEGWNQLDIKEFMCKHLS